MARHTWIIGIDEVGRGPIAGPVTVCAFAAKASFDCKKVFPNEKILDSKKLKITIRNNIYKTIRQIRKYKLDEIEYTVSSKTAIYIDKYGINESIGACIKDCLRNLEKKGISLERSYFFLDGGLTIDNSKYQQETIIKGDEKIGHIALASIMAKVTRDTYMKRLSHIHPEYGWDSNVGYGTKQHYASIKNHKLSKYHRISFIN